MSWEKPGAAAPHKPAVKAARSHATISRIASLEQAQAQLREQAPLIKKLQQKTKYQASTIDQLRDENAELRLYYGKMVRLRSQLRYAYVKIDVKSQNLAQAKNGRADGPHPTPYL